MEYQYGARVAALIHPKTHGVDTKPSALIQFHFFAVGSFGEIKSEYVAKDVSHLRVARYLQNRGAATITVFGQVKHSLRLLIDNHHVSLGIKNENPLHHAAQDRACLSFFRDDLL